MFQEPVVNCNTVYKTAVCDKLEDEAVKGVITVKASDLENFEIKMRSNGENYTKMTLKNGEWVFDRSKSGEAIIGAEKDADSLNGIRRMPFSHKKEVTVTIVMDDFSVEIFEDGRALFSTIYPPFDGNRIELSVKTDSCYYERADVLKAYKKDVWKFNFQMSFLSCLNRKKCLY